MTTDQIAKLGIYIALKAKSITCSRVIVSTVKLSEYTIETHAYDRKKIKLQFRSRGGATNLSQVVTVTNGVTVHIDNCVRNLKKFP